MKQTKIDKVQTQDNYSLDVKIDYLENSESIIIFCHGSGANTYDNHREVAGKEFNYLTYLLMNFVSAILPFVAGIQEGAEYQIFPQILCLSTLKNMQIIVRQHLFKIL